MGADSFQLAVGIPFLVLTVVLACFILVRFRRYLQAERQARRDAERASTRSGNLEALASGLSKAQTPAEIADACLSELLFAVGAGSGLVAFVHDESMQLEVVRVMGYSEPSEALPVIPLDAGTLLTEAVVTRRPMLLATAAERAETFPHLATDPLLADRQGLAILPLPVNNRAIGVVALGFERLRRWSDDEHAFLAHATRRIAFALDRAQRYARAQRERADAQAYRQQAEREIRERLKAEAALRESEARYRALAARTNRLYALSAGLSEAISLEAVARVIVRQGRTVAGASAASVALVDGDEFEMLSAEDYPRQIVDAWRRFPADAGLCASVAVKTGAPVFVGSFAEWQREYPHSASMAADGGYASAAELPLLVDGRPIGVLSFHFTVPVNFDDEYRALLTSVAQHAAQAIDRARLYEAAERARADAEAANRSKDDFLSIVSHELKTPLSAVLGWASMLRSKTLSPTRAPRAIEAIYNNATRQAELIEELLDVSRIVAGRVALDLAEIDLAANVRGAIEMILPLVEAKRLNMHLQPFPADVRVVADARRLEQVFMNLLGNAVKFTPADGHVTVTLEATAHSATVRVVDTGRGIDPAFVPHVFERFRQADTKLSRTVGGLGLGLFIAHRLVTAHGGEIGVESEGEGRGATFTVSLPRVGDHLKTDQGSPGSAPAAPAPESDDRTSLSGFGHIAVSSVRKQAITTNMMY
jgi:signal transduction histidine kinase/two-component sensor histidine kinase